MALIGSRKDIAKNDMNFFAAFTESARKTAQILLTAILIGLIFVGAFVIWWLYWIFSNMGVKSDIKDLQEKLADPVYADLEVEAQDLQNEINERNQYYYALTEMRRLPLILHFVISLERASPTIPTLHSMSSPDHSLLSRDSPSHITELSTW